MFRKRGVLRNFPEFTGKHLCQNLFFNKVAGLRPATFSKKRFWNRCFPMNFVKFLRTLSFVDDLLLLGVLVWFLTLLLELFSITVSFCNYILVICFNIDTEFILIVIVLSLWTNTLYKVNNTTGMDVLVVFLLVTLNKHLPTGSTIFLIPPRAFQKIALK